MNKATLISLVLGCIISQPAFADQALTEGLNRLAAKVDEFLEKEKLGKTVLVGDFLAPPRLKAAGGSGLKKMIQDSLEKRGIEAGGTEVQIMGKFTVRDEQAHDEDDHESVALRIMVDILDGDDEELNKIKISVFGDSALQIAGGTGDISTDLPPAKREAAKREAIKTPKAVLKGNETQSASKLFGVEVRVRQGASARTGPRTPTIDEDGRSFVDLVKGEEYVVRLHNHADFEAAVTLTIDGLSMFAFSEEGNFGSQVLVPAGKFVDIPGWYINNRDTDAFEISSYGKSAAAERNIPVTSVGVITASFHESVEGSDKSPNATARGRRIGKKYVEVKRVIKNLQSVISVRYSR